MLAWRVVLPTTGAQRHPAVWAVDPDPWTMIFVIAFSSSRIEGILALSISIKSFSFRKFIMEIWKTKIESEFTDRDNVCLVFDNSSAHVNGGTERFFNEQEIWWINIPPYSPQLNPTERLIALIKSKVWKHWMRNKPLSLWLVKRIVDDVSQENCQSLIKSSRNECLKKLKTFELLM